MRNFHLAIDGAHLINGLDFGREASMDAKNLAIDQGTKGKIVKGFVEVLPGSGAAILLDDFVVEAVHSGYLSGLMVSS